MYGSGGDKMCEMSSLSNNVKGMCKPMTKKMFNLSLTLSENPWPGIV